MLPYASSMSLYALITFALAEGQPSHELATNDQSEYGYKFKIHNYGVDKYLCVTTTCPMQNRCTSQSSISQYYVQWMDWQADSDYNCWWKTKRGSGHIQPQLQADNCLVLDFQWSQTCKNNHDFTDTCGAQVVVAPCSSPISESAKSWHRIVLSESFTSYELLSSAVANSDAPSWLGCDWSGQVGTPQCLQWNCNNGYWVGMNNVADTYYCYAGWMWLNWSDSMKTMAQCEHTTEKASCSVASCSLFESCSCHPPGVTPFSSFCYDCSCQPTPWKIVLGTLGGLGSLLSAVAGSVKCFSACKKYRHERAERRRTMEVPLT